MLILFYFFLIFFNFGGESCRFTSVLRDDELQGVSFSADVHHGGADQSGGGRDQRAGGRQLRRAAAGDLPQPRGERHAEEEAGAHRVPRRAGLPDERGDVGLRRAGGGGRRVPRRGAGGFHYRTCLAGRIVHRAAESLEPQEIRTGSRVGGDRGCDSCKKRGFFDGRRGRGGKSRCRFDKRGDGEIRRERRPRRGRAAAERGRDGGAAVRHRRQRRGPVRDEALRLSRRKRATVGPEQYRAVGATRAPRLPQSTGLSGARGGRRRREQFLGRGVRFGLGVELRRSVVRRGPRKEALPPRVGRESGLAARHLGAEARRVPYRLPPLRHGPGPVLLVGQPGPPERGGARRPPAVPEAGLPAAAPGLGVGPERRRLPPVAGPRRIPAGPPGAQPVLPGQALRLQLLRQVLHVVAQPGDARARPHGRAAVQLRPVRQALHAVGSPEDAPERPHRRAAVRLRAVRQAIRREAEPEDPPAETPPGRTPAASSLAVTPIRTTDGPGPRCSY